EELDKRVVDMIRSSRRIIREEKKEKTYYNIFFFKPMSIAVAASIILVLFLSIIFLRFSKYSTFITKYKYISTVTNINGNAVKLNGNIIQNLMVGDKIRRGDTIKTDKNSKCEIQFGDFSIALLDENSLLQFNDGVKNTKDIKLDLAIGRILIKIEKELKNICFQVNTEYATVSTYGTQFVVESYPNKSSLIAVNEGNVKVDTKFEGKEASNKTLIISKEESLSVKKNDFIKEKVSPRVKEIFNDFQYLHLQETSEISKNKDSDLKRWKAKKIYRHNYTGDPSKNKILGFASYKNYVLAQTEVSLICFKSNGEIIWEKIYGEKDGLYFMSIPVIYEDKIYLSSINKRFLILDLKNGELVKKINSPGNITFGYNVVPYENIIYIPYRDGVYSLQLNDYSLSDNPVISFNYPTIPLILKNNIYLSSFVYKNISGFDFNGNKLWNYTMDEGSFNSPILVNENIFITNNAKTIYKISVNGKILKKSILPQVITSRLIGKDKELFALANDGYIYNINTESLIYTKMFKVDEDPDISGYLFKYPAVSNNKLIIGTDNGEIIIYNLKSQQIENKLMLSTSPISTSISYSGKSFFTGTKDGEVFLLKYN
ncbi:MAG: FecR domain-containing protein, partial [Spirochaetes bacterium]|nr:FecR domain-containing protein [Spirochaetota bacterium]